MPPVSALSCASSHSFSSSCSHCIRPNLDWTARLSCSLSSWAFLASLSCWASLTSLSNWVSAALTAFSVILASILQWASLSSFSYSPLSLVVFPRSPKFAVLSRTHATVDPDILAVFPLQTISPCQSLLPKLGICVRAKWHSIIKYWGCNNVSNVITSWWVRYFITTYAYILCTADTSVCSSSLKISPQ